MPKGGWEPLGRWHKREHFAAPAQTGCWETRAAAERRDFHYSPRSQRRYCLCFAPNTEEQHSKSSFSSNIPNIHEAAERLFSFQNLNVLHGSINDSRHGPPDPTVRNSLCESRHSNWGSNVAAHCDSLSSWFTAVALSRPWKPLNEMKPGFLHLIDSLPQTFAQRLAATLQVCHWPEKK